MAIALTYDVDSSHDEIKDYLITEKGYIKQMKANKTIGGADGVIDLPNTTLYHETRDADTGYNDLYEAANEFEAKVEKLVVFPLSDEQVIGVGRPVPVPRMRLIPRPRKF